MFKIVSLALTGALTLASAAQVQPVSTPRFLPPVHAAAPASNSWGPENLAVYYTPLSSTDVSRFVGFGTAYHMAIVYTDAHGTSYGASSGPSNLKAQQTPAYALTALASSVNNVPSEFGTLASDPHNNTPFIKGSASDYYTRDSQRRPYPTAVVVRGRDLAKQWATIIQTYTTVGGMRLTYSPISQNSNSLAVTALRRAGYTLPFSSATMFTPGSFTQLPEG